MAQIVVNGNSVEAMVTIGCDAGGNGGTGLIEPGFDGYEGMTATIVDTQTNAKGEIIGAVICEGVGKVSLRWPYLTVAEWASILQLFDGTQGGSFFNLVKFFDQATGDYVVREMYPSDRKAKGYKRDTAGNLVGWRDCSFNLVDTRRRNL